MEELTSSNDYRFREATKDERDAIDENFTALGKEARSQYERALKKVGYLWTEAHQYNMEALKVLQEAICGGKEKVKDAWNACMAFNHLGSIDQQEQEKFMRDLCTPLYDHIKKCLPAFEGKTPSEREANFDSYVHAKSGLERNRTIFVRDAIREMAKEDPDAAQDLQNDYDAKRAELKAQLDKGGQYTLREFYQDLDKWINDNIGEFDANTMDRSGLSDMEKYGDKWAVSDKGEYNDAEVINHVIECESKMGKDVTDNLWNQIGKIGQFSIDKDYNSHYINEKAKKRMETMFGWYVPMRGFNEMTADEQWNYLNGGDNYVGMTAMKMNGRISAPKSVIPTLLAMGDAAILRGNRNMAKQTLLRMVRENENDLMREVKIHYIKDIDPNTGEITLTPIYPAFKEGDTPAQVDKAMEDLDSKIEQLKASGKEVVELSDMTSSQPYRITNESNLKEHLINMRVNGKNVSLMVFSHPRAAQAVNGMLTNTGSKKLREFNAVLSQLATSRSLTFMARNAIRDYGLGVNSALATESLNWQKNYHAMYWKLIGNFVANTVKGNALMENGNSMLQLFAKYRANKLDESNEVEKYFKQFVENGGVTGYVQMRGVDQMHEELNKAITSFKNADTTGKAQKAWDNTIGKWFDIVESYNEGIENQSRFAAFYASRKEGRSIMRSVDDAKNISVNFNKTGAGSATQSMKWGDETHWYKMNRYLASHSAWLLKNCSLFYNAGIQGMSRNYQIWKDGGVFTRTKMIAAFMAKPFALALGMPALCGMIASMLDDDEDRKKYGDNPYLQLPEYERRQNACFYIGHGRFIKVPLAVEIRAAYGLGDIASGVVLGNKELLGDEDPVSQSVAQLAQLTPVDVFGGSKLWGSSVAGTFVPSILQPILATTISDASGYYRGWTGSRITNANGQWNADDPNWTKATDKTSPFAVEAAHSLNTGSYMVKRWVEKSLFGNNLPENPDAADGTGVEKGYINIDPGKMQYLFEQYGSGPLKDINEFSETLTNMVEAEEVDKGKIPILKAVYRDNVPTNVRNNDKARWYRYKDDAESLLHEATRYSKHGSTLYGRELLSSKEGTIAQRVKHWDKYITKRRKAMNKTSDPVVKEACQDQINEAIHSAMQEIDAIEKKK